MEHSFFKFRNLIVCWLNLFLIIISKIQESHDVTIIQANVWRTSGIIIHKVEAVVLNRSHSIIVIGRHYCLGLYLQYVILDILHTLSIFGSRYH